jgi:RNA:NAD 2'-phosphotransferase (TPT1/KptA family)
MSRHHVHLSQDVDTAWNVASRRKYDTPVVLEISTSAVMKAGCSFYVASNGVVLVDYVPWNCVQTVLQKNALTTFLEQQGSKHV